MQVDNNRGLPSFRVLVIRRRGEFGLDLTLAGGERFCETGHCEWPVENCDGLAELVIHCGGPFDYALQQGFTAAQASRALVAALIAGAIVQYLVG